MFPIEFKHHMRRYCGWSGAYSPDVIESYNSITGIDCAHIEMVASGNVPPCDEILTLMNIERVRVEYEFYRKSVVNRGADGE
jgi:hypothetical protein